MINLFIYYSKLIQFDVIFHAYLIFEDYSVYNTKDGNCKRKSNYFLSLTFTIITTSAGLNIRPWNNYLPIKVQERNGGRWKCEQQV